MSSATAAAHSQLAKQTEERLAAAVEDLSTRAEECGKAAQFRLEQLGAATIAAQSQQAKHGEERLNTTAAELGKRAEEGFKIVTMKLEQMGAATAGAHVQLAKQGEERLLVTATELGKRAQEGDRAVLAKLDQHKRWQVACASDRAGKPRPPELAAPFHPGSQCTHCCSGSHPGAS